MDAGHLPDWFLGSSEQRGDFARVRACWVEKVLRGPDKREYLLVRVEPPVIGQPFGMGGADIPIIVVAPRHRGATLSPLTGDGTAVQVYLPRRGVDVQTGSFGQDDLELVAWGEVYRSAVAAAGQLP